MDAVVEEREEIVGDDAFERLAVEETQAKPEAIELGTAQEGTALRFEIVVEIADKINRADAGERKLFVLAVLSEEVNGIELAEARGIEIAAEGFAVIELDDHLFVGAGWGAEFQRTRLTPCKGAICTE